MAGEGGVDIDLYATVDEFEPEVAGQVRFREEQRVLKRALTEIDRTR